MVEILWILLEWEVLSKDRYDKGDVHGDGDREKQIQRKCEEPGIDQGVKENTSDDQGDSGGQEITEVSEKRK